MSKIEQSKDLMPADGTSSKKIERLKSLMLTVGQSRRKNTIKFKLDLSWRFNKTFSVQIKKMELILALTKQPNWVFLHTHPRKQICIWWKTMFKDLKIQIFLCFKLAFLWRISDWIPTYICEMFCKLWSLYTKNVLNLHQFYS